MRESVSRAHLLELLNAQLAEYSGCEDCQFDGPIFRLQEPDVDGANWSDVITLRCSGRAAGPCLDHAPYAIAIVRRSYNLVEDG